MSCTLKDSFCNLIEYVTYQQEDRERFYVLCPLCLFIVKYKSLPFQGDFYSCSSMPQKMPSGNHAFRPRNKPLPKIPFLFGLPNYSK